MVKIIGEGTYGCVTKPSMPCDDKNLTSQNKGRLSKIMNKKDADEELYEMKDLVNVPGIQKYILSIPQICTPKIDKTFLKTVQNCQSRHVAQTQNITDLRLLLVEDGGVDLQVFSTEIASSLNKPNMAIFLSSVVNLIKGVSFFRHNDIIHSDIKEYNIVYNVKKGSIKFIDFGLVRKKSEFISSSIQNVNTRAKSWGYLPKENSCAMKQHFEILPKCEDYRNDYHNDFHAFIEDAANSFDSFCLAGCLLVVFSQIFEYDDFGFTANLFRDLELLFLPYAQKQLVFRKWDLQVLEHDYIQILKKYGAYTKTSKPKLSDKTKSLANKFSIVNTSMSHSKSKKQTISPVFPLEIHPEGKMRKSRAQRIQNITKLMTKPCPTGKIRNPKTGYCINNTIKKQKPPCPSGKERNSVTGRCRKTKKRKAFTSTNNSFFSVEL